MNEQSAVNKLLRDVWEARLDEANEVGMARADSYADALFHVGLISSEQLELWKRRFRECPGHEACRSWCAYCGDLPHAKDCECDFCEEDRQKLDEEVEERD